MNASAHTALVALAALALSASGAGAQAGPGPAIDWDAVPRWTGPVLVGIGPAAPLDPLTLAGEQEAGGSAFPAAFAMASLGSGVGTVAGWHAGSLVAGDGAAAIVGAVVGSVLLATAGAHIATAHTHDDGPGRAARGAVAGIVPGFIGGFAGAVLTAAPWGFDAYYHFPWGFLAGYALAQGLTTAWVAAPGP